MGPKTIPTVPLTMPKGPQNLSGVPDLFGYDDARGVFPPTASSGSIACILEEAGQLVSNPGIREERVRRIRRKKRPCKVLKGSEPEDRNVPPELTPGLIQS